MSFTKITEGDLANKGVTGLPDTPNLSTTEMQQKFDELAKDVIVPKFNELSDELDEKNLDKATVSEDITNFQLDADGRLQVSTDGGETYGYAGSTGHAIMDGSGTVYPARARLQFSQNVGITDDEVNNKTFLSVQGQKGDQGDAATIRVGTVGSGLTPSVTNVGSSQDAIFDFVFPKGDSGDAATIQVGTVQSGNNPSVTNRGTSSSAIFDFVLPKGEKGDPGTGLTLLDTYPTLAALQAAHPTGQRGDAYLVGDASDSTVYLWSTVNNQWSDVGSLKGAKGDTGDSATVSVGTVTEGNTVAVENVGTSENAIFNFTLKKGDKGDKGNSGTISVGSVQGGEIASVTNVGTSTDAIFDFVIPKGDKGDKGDPTSINGKSGLSVTLYGTDIDVDDSVSAKTVSQALSDIQDEIDNMNTGGSIIRVTCDEDFAGNTLTMEVNGTLIQTLEVPSVAPYVVEFSTIELGTATITNTDTSDTFDVELTTYSLYTATFATFGYQGWLDSAGITTQFASLAEVLADQPTVRILMNKHASVDYLVEWLNANTDTQDTFLASENALKWIGLRDYAYDTITSSVEGFLASWLDGEYWEYALKDKVPVMTANNAPYGVASAYQVFDGNASTSASGTDFSYQFVNPISIKKFESDIADGTLQVSDDGTTWITNDNGYHLYARVHYSSSQTVHTIQFYGRQLSVSVPKMTSNTEPWGEAFGGSSGGNAYKYFDRDTSTGWDDDSYFGYTFNEAKIVNRLMLYTRPSYNSANKHKFQASNDGTNWIDLLSEEDMSVMTAASTYYYFDIDNNTAYTRYRVFHSNTGVGGFDGFKECQLYGPDYSEHEERHWIYDHGVEVESLTAYTNNANAQAQKRDYDLYVGKNATSNTIGEIYTPSIDLSDYALMRAVISDEYKISNAGTFLMGVYPNTPIELGQSLGDANVDLNANANIPDTLSLNIANFTQSKNLGLVACNVGSAYSGYFSFKEWWLE